MSNNIDRASRNQLSQSLRYLVSGQITNDQFEDNAPRRSGDRAIWAIRHKAWFLYDDLKEHELKGKYALPKAAKGVVARWILFLQTNLKYEWPTYPGETWWGAILGLFSFGLIPKLFWNKKWLQAGNSKLWPFIREKDLRRARKSPKFFRGSIVKPESKDLNVPAHQ